MDILIDNKQSVYVDNKVQTHERVRLTDGTHADVHVTLLGDRVMFEVIAEDDARQPTGARQWIRSYEEIAEWLLSQQPES